MSNPWLDKCRMLDRYRWLLLRERHGLLGSVLRFVRDASRDWILGVRAMTRLVANPQTQSCDFLLLQSMTKVIPLQRKRLLKDALVARGYSLVETALPEPGEMLRQRMLCKPPFPIPVRYFGYAAHAQWLVERYHPRVLLNDRNGSLYAPFLRLALNARQNLLVHLAHATTVESSRRLGMNDYDYYFLFGRSSLEALQKRTLRFGSSTAVLAGSHMIDNTYDLAPADPELRTILILGVGPDKEKEAGYKAAYELLRDWAREHSEYKVLFRAHPRSQAAFWRQVASEIPQLTVLSRDCHLADALQRASMVINIMSNAVIEAALARRPVISISVSGERDIFALQRFFGPGVASVDALQAQVSAAERGYRAAVEQSSDFAEYHLANGCAGLPSTLDALATLLERRTPPGDLQVIHSTVELAQC
ncbi:capsule biosynthesis protein [Pseudomonas sp. CNPSo 3701]|uniref:capsule biosynthesis protein n=1 Tax=Pseudomonas sp. CNPSo 3701 TaxID=3027943 RepID=UPI002363BD7C|nr:capsule biosynthesis protein [Pseudomonas sp. CNPSo 3701]MDD1510122.1 capsule biosynthesis protein [Pseudomonas sp. CNPSo 3701]